MDKINAQQCKSKIMDFNIGDTVKVYSKIIEGETERIQMFSGVVIARKGSGINENFTVRRIAFGQGMERVYPLHSPRIDKIEIERKGKVRRAKLYYLRDKIGKSARVQDASYSK
jgi:large subunit ribosomal protein L19